MGHAQSRNGRGLAAWFAIGHPRYRGLLAVLLLLGTGGAILSYMENAILAGFARAFDPTAAAPSWAAWLPFALPWVLLAAFAAIRLTRAGVSLGTEQSVGRLRIRSWSDIEHEVLGHLLRKDDGFFTEHPPAEMVTRLGQDAKRAADRRLSVMQVWKAAMLIAGNLVFFFQNDWRLGTVAVLVVILGTAITQRLLRPVQALDRRFLRENDDVRSLFADFLSAAPEIQVGNLSADVRQRFRTVQDRREQSFLGFTRLNGLLAVSNVVMGMIAFVAMIFVALTMQRTGMVASALPLIPVVIWAMPKLFDNASRIVMMRLHFQMADTSIERLLEYETAFDATAGDRDRDEPAPQGAAAVTLDHTSFRYTDAHGTPQGGVSDISTRLEPDRWTAVVGRAGSGKSTLLQLILGRLQPQQGEIRYGAHRISDLSAATTGTLFSLLPQKPLLLDTSIRENLLFGRGAGASLDGSDLELVESLGIGRLVRQRALEMRPDEGGGDEGHRQILTDAREKVRSRLLEELSVTVAPFAEDATSPEHWVVESLLRGRANRRELTARLTTQRNLPVLRALAQSSVGARLRSFAVEVLEETRQLLQLPDYDAYARLAPTRVPESVWSLRRRALGVAPEVSDSPEAVLMVQIGLTAAPAEAGNGAAACMTWLHQLPTGDATLSRLARLVGDASALLTRGKTHPELNWRDNLIFGNYTAANQRKRKEIDATILAALASDREREALTRIGLEFRVGRRGERLSGGQGQLVALCRTLLRRTPVIVLDEPTSALDPASRERVAKVLASWKPGRTILTISHDPALVRHADEIRLLNEGQLMASGEFSFLQRESALFREVFHLAQPGESPAT